MPSFPITSRFHSALVFASEKHTGQFRKETAIPYISHPLAVSSLVLEYGGTEDQAIAALLHDTMEDCEVSQLELAERFGSEVAHMVADCTDTVETPKPPWRHRKEKYIEHLAEVSASTLLVSACDKLHNSRAIAHDVAHFGPQVWKRFSAAPLDIIWYYESLLAAFEARKGEAVSQFEVLLKELRTTIGPMKALAH